MGEKYNPAKTFVNEHLSWDLGNKGYKTPGEEAQERRYEEAKVRIERRKKEARGEPVIFEDAVNESENITHALEPDSATLEKLNYDEELQIRASRVASACTWSIARRLSGRVEDTFTHTNYNTLTYPQEDNTLPIKVLPEEEQLIEKIVIKTLADLDENGYVNTLFSSLGREAPLQAKITWSTEGTKDGIGTEPDGIVMLEVLKDIEKLQQMALKMHANPSLTAEELLNGNQKKEMATEDIKVLAGPFGDALAELQIDLDTASEQKEGVEGNDDITSTEVQVGYLDKDPTGVQFLDEIYLPYYESAYETFRKDPGATWIKDIALEAAEYPVIKLTTEIYKRIVDLYLDPDKIKAYLSE